MLVSSWSITLDDSILANMFVPVTFSSWHPEPPQNDETRVVKDDGSYKFGTTTFGTSAGARV
jgi:hypothetical protein